MWGRNGEGEQQDGHSESSQPGDIKAAVAGGQQTDKAWRHQHPCRGGDEERGSDQDGAAAEMVQSYERESSDQKGDDQRDSSRTYRCPGHRASIGTHVRPYSPMYSLSGRISRLSACCSMTCAVQPAIREMANTGVNRSVGIPSAR